MQRGKISIFASFFGHLRFLRKMKSVNISKTLRDGANSSEFLTRRVVQVSNLCRVEKFQFSPLLVTILDFSGK